METTDEKRFETADKAEISADGPLLVAAETELVARLRVPASEDLRFSGSNDSVRGGSATVAMPSYCTYQYMHQQRHDNAYHCPSPFFHHVGCQRHCGASCRINVCVAVVVIRSVFLLEHAPEARQLVIDLRKARVLRNRLASPERPWSLSTYLVHVRIVSP